MELVDASVIVTGGASGIGAALCRRFVAEGAARVIVADQDADGARAVAREIGATAFEIDVADEDGHRRLVHTALDQAGQIDLFCSNAGIACTDGPGGTAASASNAHWQRSWEVNVMAHVYAARAVLPHMLERGSGCLLNVASAAGLLNQIGSAPYTATKHAAVAFAESLAITHGDDGIQVAVLCPQYVETGMTKEFAASGMLSIGELLQPDEVAKCVMVALREKRFLILPHPIVGDYQKNKSADPDRWIGGMRKLRRKLLGNS